MNKIRMVNREMTSEEVRRMNSGFDELALDEGAELESSERFSIVALEGKTFIGCSSGLAYKNGDHYSGWFFITDLFVEKEYRSMGLGTKLLKALEKEMVSLQLKQVWLWTSGHKALNFYSRHDYKKFTELENYYSDGSSRVGLRKNL